MVFFPFRYPQGYWQPAAFGLNVKDCFFTTRDSVRLHGWWLANPDARWTMLWCHGNAGNISDRLDNLARLAKLPINVFLFDYRGFGKSAGSPTESGVYLDAEAAYDFLVREKNIPPDNMVFFGRSLGGAVAVELATRRPCQKLILESTFTSARDMAKQLFGPLPVHWASTTRLDSERKIAQIRVPLLMLHGNDDRTVPYALGRRLFEAANEPKHFYDIEGADHNDTYIVGGKAYFDQIAGFLLD